MADEKEQSNAPKSSEGPLVFISHDTRDAACAEAFSKLLRSVSAGMLKTFRSSDKKGSEGIEFGDEWYKTLMSKLDIASDVVCLLTEQSLDRPWILYEAGVAKGKLGTPVQGLALGVPLSRVSTGPFYQFQNSDDSDDSLSKLVRQLCTRVPGCDPEQSVVDSQVRVFKETVAAALKDSTEGTRKADKKTAIGEAATAKLLEEMKLLVRDLPVRIDQIMMEGTGRIRSRRLRRVHPMMIEEMAHMISRREGDPIGVLIISSLVRDDFPWLYEIGLEAYRAARSGKPAEVEDALRAFEMAADITLRGPFAEEMGLMGKEAHMLLRELPMIIEHYLHRVREKPIQKRKRITKEPGSGSEETNTE